MYFLDCKGKTCPVPVLETKRTIEERDPRDLTVAVDNDVSRENVRRFLESRGYQTTVEGKEGSFSVIGHKEEEGSPQVEAERTVHAAKPVVTEKVTVFIDGETLGRGDDRLGAILMKTFLMTLKELKPLPWRIVFINGGVKLVAEGSELLPTLKDLENLGIEILSCGTCLDFYGLKETLKAGRISNMFEIVTTLTSSSNVLKP
jgi:selenium metabolism protein YedF